MIDIKLIRVLLKQKSDLEKEYDFIKNSRFNSQANRKLFNTEINKLDRKIERASKTPSIKGYKSKKTATNAYQRYSDLYADEFKQFQNSKKDLFAGISDRSVLNDNLYSVSHSAEIERKRKIDKLYREGKLDNKTLLKEIARKKARARNNIFEGRNTKLQEKRSQYINLENQFMKAQVNNGYAIKDPNGPGYIITPEGIKNGVDHKLKNLRRSFEKKTPEQYAKYFLEKTGKFGKYEEGMVYNSTTGELDFNRFENLRDNL